MDSSNITEISSREDEVNDLSFIDSNLNNSSNKGPSFDDVEESLLEDCSIAEKNSENTELKINPHQNRNNSYISSDEDVSFEVISRGARKPRIRIIACDSENEGYEQNTSISNLSFTNHRSAKPLDSDEDDYDDGTSMKHSYNEVNSSGESDNNENKSITDVVESEVESEVENSIESNTSQTEKDILEPDTTNNEPEDIKIESSDEDTSVSDISKPAEESNKLQQLTLNDVVKNMSLIEVSEKGDTNQMYCTAAEYANQSSKVSILRTDIPKGKDCSIAEKNSENTELKVNPHQNRNNSYISSDEDVSYEVISRWARKPRIRRITSDSADEGYKQNTPISNLSSTNHRSAKPLDSDEDDYDDGTSMKHSYNEVISSGESDNNENKSITDVVENSIESNSSQTEKDILEPNTTNDEPEDIINIESSDEDTSVSDISKPSEKSNKLQQLTLNDVVKNMSLIEVSEKGDTNQMYCTAAGYANQSSKVSILRTDIPKGKDCSIAEKNSENTELKVNPHQNRNNIYISSDEDVSYEVISRWARKPRIRRITSDSADEGYKQNTTISNLSSTNHRSAKPLDSDEDDYDDGTSMKHSYNEVNSSGESDNNENKSITDVVENSIESNSSQTEKDILGPNTTNDEPEDIINIESSDEDTSVSDISKPSEKSNKLQQLTLNDVVKNMSLIEVSEKGDTNQMYCTAAEYANQSSKVSILRTDILKCKNILRTINLSSLPDKGALLLQRQNKVEKQFRDEEEKLNKMVVTEKLNAEKDQKLTWDQLHANSEYVVPKTFGKQAMNTYVVQKTVTMNRLKNLHDSLASCPTADTQAEDPKGLKVNLMSHQKHGLAWLLWRESQKPAGGILADDMGLGKTLTIISLILASKDLDIKENESDEESKGCISKNSKYCVEGGTLVICPASLIRQWENEIETKVKRNLLSSELYHGSKRENKASRLAKYDVVITTYKLAQNEFEKKGPLHQIKWKRVVLDEAHIIRNHKTQTSVAICNLKAKARWALTGTPVHNTELDLYALLKFLRCSPFDDLAVWKRWVANKNAGGQERLNTVITSILLRRTKDQLQTQGSLQSLPEKKFQIIDVKLDSSEKQVYEKVLVFSRTLFIQFLRQRAEKNPDFTNIKGGNLTQTNDEEYNKMYKKIMQMHGNTEVKSHEILVLLLRLRQICCHPSLISSMLNEEDCDTEGIEEDGVDMDLLDKLNHLNVDEENNTTTDTTNLETLTTAASKVLNPSNEVFASNRANEKLRIIKQIIEEKVLPNNDKVIIVSQWTSMLNVIMSHLKTAKIVCDILDGKVPVYKRNDIVEDFNNPSSKTKVLLLSLTAGGVGLNLVGANHLLLVDLHWNPQLETQAQDRIYRVGQKKTVYIYKIVTSDTIEEKIKHLQDNKLSLAQDILSGVKHGASSKLSLDDLKMLFSVAG